MIEAHITQEEREEVAKHQAQEAHYRKYKNMPLDNNYRPVAGVGITLAREALSYFRCNLTDRERALLQMSRIEEITLSVDDWYDCVRLKRYVMGLEEVIAKNQNYEAPYESDTQKKKKWSPNDHANRDY
jgi:hypothetical protein